MNWNREETTIDPISCIMDFIVIIIFVSLVAGCATTTQKCPEKKRNIPVHNKLAQATVELLHEDKSIGTGWVYKGHIVTNWHLCLKDKLAVRYQDKLYRAKLVKVEPSNDLCLLDTNIAIPGLELSNSDLFRGETLQSVGYPYGDYTTTEGAYIDEMELSVKFGTHESKMREGITTLLALPGSSGSAVVNSNGQVVGMIQGANQCNEAAFVLTRNLREFLEK